LAEALYVINKAHRPKKEREWLDRQPPELRAGIEKYNQRTLLNKGQLANPMPVVKKFCKRFTWGACLGGGIGGKGKTNFAGIHHCPIISLPIFETKRPAC